MGYKKSIRIIVFFVTMLTLSACSKEKAEAIKVAAESFKSDAVLAIDKINELYDLNVSVAKYDEEQEVAKIIKDLKELDTILVSAEMMDFWFVEPSLGNAAIELNKVEFSKLKLHFTTFEAMFTNLDKGHYFAKEAVKKAEKHAINLTLELINYSQIIKELPFRNMAERVQILDKMQQAQKEKDAKFKKTLIENAAKDLVALRIREEKLKEDTIRQCLKAAESSKVIAELIKDYEKLNVEDILNIVKSSLSYGSDITGSQDISDLLTKFEGIETEIKNDPYWKVLIDQQIN